MNGTDDIENIKEREIADITGTVDVPAEDVAPVTEKTESEPPPPSGKAKPARKPIDFPFLLLLIILIGLAVRIALLITENKVYVDGVHYLLQGQNIRSGIWDTWDPNGGRWSVPPLYPLFVAFALSFIHDLMRAGQVASMVVALTIIPAIYLIARSFLGEKGGLWAAFIAAIDPLTTHYSIVTYAEPTFIAMTVWCVWFSILCVEKKERILPPILMGFFAALAYLAKAFGLALGIWGFVLLLYYAITSRDKKISIRLRNLVLYSISFLIIAIPYWMFLVSYLGHWAPDGKSQFEFTRLHAPNIKLESIDPRYEGLITQDYEYAIYKGEPQFGRLSGMDFTRTFATKYIQKLKEIFYFYPIRPVPPFTNVYLTSTLLLILLGLGLLAVPLTLSRSATPRILLAWFPLWLFIMPLGFIEVRYFVPFAVLLIPFIASGMYHFEDWLRNTSIFSPPPLRGLIIPFMVVLILMNGYASYSYRFTHINSVEKSYWEYKIAGEFMKEYTGGKGGNIIESADMIAFYAGMQGWVTPQTDYDGLIHFMLKHDIRFFAMTEYLTMKKHQRPELNWLFKFPPVETNELKPVYWDDEYEGHRVVIYELKNEVIEMWNRGMIE